MEKTGLADRIRAMEPEELQLAVRLIPSGILIGEVARRSSETEKMISGIKGLLKMGEGDSYAG